MVPPVKYTLFEYQSFNIRNLIERKIKLNIYIQKLMDDGIQSYKNTHDGDEEELWDDKLREKKQK